jgi:hypothetical protein
MMPPSAHGAEQRPAVGPVHDTVGRTDFVEIAQELAQAEVRDVQAHRPRAL